MNGIPYSIWRDFPHPSGPNLGGRAHVPLTNFEVILARQILSCSRSSQSRAPLLHGGMHAASSNASDERLSGRQRRYPCMLVGGDEDIVGNSGHKTLEMNDAFVELPVDDSASTDSSESEGVGHVHNPSFFSHRATVEDLIASFNRHTIGPLAGVDITSDLSQTSGDTPVIIISDAVSQRTLDCALERWRVEQEEKELEMRWRATKRISENWLTKVELVRERQRARREKIQREREKGKTKTGGGASRSLAAKKPATSQGKRPEVISHIKPPSSAQVPPQSMTPPHSKPTQSQLGSRVSHLAPTAPHSTDDPALASASGSLLPHLKPAPLVTLPTLISIHPGPSLQAAIPQEYVSPVSPKYSHVPYDPRMPGLALEEFAHIPLDSGQPGQMPLPESAAEFLVPAGPGSLDVTEQTLMQDEALEDYVQQYFDVSQMQMSQSPLPPDCASPSSDFMMPMLPSPIHDAIVPDVFSGDCPAHSIPQEGTLPRASSPLQAHLDNLSSLLTLDEPLDEPHSQPLASGSWLRPSHPSAQSPESQVQLAPHTGSSPAGSSGHPQSQPAPVPGNLGVNSDVTQSPPVTPAPSEPTAEEKMMWHVWSLTQSPLSTAADVILRDPHASRQSNLSQVFSKLFPNFRGSQDEAARVKILTGSATIPEGEPCSATPHYMPLAGTSTESDCAWASFPSTAVSLTEASALSMLAPRTILVNPAYSAVQPTLSSPAGSVGKHAASHDQFTSAPPHVPTSRPAPVLITQDLPLSSLPPGSHTDSPMSPASGHTATTALLTESGEHSNSPSGLYPQYMPMGTRLFRIARLANIDVLRPSYWFEPDDVATETMRNVVNLMERSGGWKGPERKAHGRDGARKARGPDDLASF
ncbi:hypothetical protein JB92DRAFT_2892124 [Gautieria morchelliformis]|nr:hypothetical protein JB92DRAFT_2892124 [Gautieria morchelliformis]